MTNTILILIWLHFIADFVLQSNKMATRKSTSWLWLTNHVVWYMVPFIFVFGVQFTLINGALHFITDAVTSRVTSHLWKKQEVHWFFVTIGLDQAIHLTTLILTYNLLS